MHLSSQSLVRIMIGVYSRIGHGTHGLYCPSCPGKAHLRQCYACIDSDFFFEREASRIWNGGDGTRIWKCDNCSYQLPRASTSKDLRPPTLDDLKGWAAVMHSQDSKYMDERTFSLPEEK